MKITVPAGLDGDRQRRTGSPAAARLRPTAPSPAIVPAAEREALAEPRLSRGRSRTPAPAKQPPAPATSGGKTFTFEWTKPSFPGTIIAGNFQESSSNAVGLNLHVFFKPSHKDMVSNYTETAVREFQFYSANLGPPLSNNLNIVELPDDTVPSAWAPEMAAIASRALTGKAELPAAGEHHRAPVVGRRRQPGHAAATGG